MKKISIILLFLSVLFLGGWIRVNLFSKVGRDSFTYKRAVMELIEGTNPYEYTIHTFEKEKQDWDHGFSYLPAMLYVIAPFYFIGEMTGVDPAILWKIPVLVADILIAVLLFKASKEKQWLGILASAAWLLNPYIILKSNYTYTDPIAILFMLLAILYLEKDEVLTGVFFALSVLFKTFPIILFPLLFIRSKNKWKFLAGGFFVTLLFVLPFLGSFEDFRTMLYGSLFVHGERVIQGRPFLYFFSYLTNIELFRVIPTKFYALSSIILGVLISLFGALYTKLDKFLVSTMAFVGFYILTPVLNRTYLLWFMPLFLLASIKTLKPKYSVLIITAFYIFYSWYLFLWIDGYHITQP